MIMSSTGQGKRTPINKQTYIKADNELIERAEKAMEKLKIDSKIQLAIRTELSPSTINRFFQKQAIRPDSYNQICETLSLNKKIVIGEEKFDFTISGRIDKKLIEELKCTVEVLRKLTDGDLSFLTKEDEEEDME
ncbi:MAG: hypothetical protein F6K40_29810 [Okeania sp. SIO3I5]|uniref:hypothetical protein n=1 Tax=Okeania sp. SIO3I5 TaxID=2607805 RepID=UPI0013BB2CDA|nr:hypothetical protein [Okeania sp. SIO3I5]NEQ40214.1 hypothetical protein [Okeania sp. SIO3I5]